MSYLSIRLLGEFFVGTGEVPLTALGSPRLQSLLAYLLLQRSAPQPRRQIAFLLWPDSSETQARTNLRKLLHELRRSLPSAAEFLTSEGDTLQWRREASFTLDVAEFENALDRATTTAALERAVEFYRGDLLPNCYDDWVAPERERLRQRCIHALEQLVEQQESAGGTHAAIRSAQRLLQLDPVREETYRRLVQLYARVGDRAAALATYRKCAEVLELELGVEPSSATRAEYERLLRPQIPPNNLFKPLSNFIGRERELVQVQRLVRETRLLTLSGPGGIGKTRLALEAAPELLRDFRDGVWFIELDALQDGALVPQAVAAALDVRQTRGRSLPDSLIQELRAKQLLLILDNCEHLREACARFGETLLRACPEVRILATSREPLGLAGERTQRVPPLSLPGLETDAPGEALPHSEAVRLFMDRAQAAWPGFTLHDQNADDVARICRRLDGIPLALELAAAWVTGLSPAEISARLDDRFQLLHSPDRTRSPRHRALRATIEWSYDLLDEQERTLLRRLSIFSNSWDLAGAAAVAAGGTIQARRVLDLLLQLVNKSLVIAEGVGQATRYRMLDTIRALAREKLRETRQETKFARAHAEYFFELVRAAEPNFFGPDLERWLDRLELELDNLRAALEWSKDAQGDGAALGLEAAGLLWRFWELRGHLEEGRRWLDALLAKGADLPPAARHYALHTAGNLANNQGDRLGAKKFYEECLAASKQIGNRLLVAHMYNNLANLATGDGEYARAAALYGEALQGYEELGAQWPKGMVLGNLGNVARLRGEYDRAHALYAADLKLFQELGDKERMALALNELAELARCEGDGPTATSRANEALQLYGEVGDPLGSATAHLTLAEIASGNKGFEAAQAHIATALALFSQAGSRDGIARATARRAHLLLQQNETEAAKELYRDAWNTLQELGEQAERLSCLEGLARVAAKEQDAWNAVRLFGFAQARRQLMGTPLAPSLREEQERELAVLREQLGSRQFAAAWEEGRALDWACILSPGKAGTEA